MAKPNYWHIVNKVIENSDVVLEVLDARLIDETRNIEIEKRIKDSNKKLIHVVNKIDLINPNAFEFREKLKELTHPVFVASKKKLGTTILKKRILEVARKNSIVAGVVGYPNTGKSSVINAISGRKSARTSPTSGFTKGLQKIRAGERIMLLDTPGVIPFEDNDIIRHALIGSKNPESMKEPDYVAMKLIQILHGLVEEHYKIEKNDDIEVVLENIAKKMHRFKKGGAPDIDSASKTIIMEWQRGKIK